MENIISKQVLRFAAFDKEFPLSFQDLIGVPVVIILISMKYILLSLGSGCTTVVLTDCFLFAELLNKDTDLK